MSLQQQGSYGDGATAKSHIMPVLSERNEDDFVLQLQIQVNGPSIFSK